MLLTAEDVAKRWGVPRSHVYRLVREDRAPAVKLGRYVRFEESALREWERKGGTVREAA